MIMIDRLVPVVGLVALALAFAFGVSGYTSTAANEASAGPGIDTLALTNSAGDLPHQYFPAF